MVFASVGGKAGRQGRVRQRQLTVERLRARIRQKEGDYPHTIVFRSVVIIQVFLLLICSSSGIQSRR